MARPFDREPFARDYPPPARRRCVLIGMAELVKRPGKEDLVGYRWGRIAEAWLAWPGSNLREFCWVHHIAYHKATRRPEMSLARKAAMGAELARARQEAIIAAIRVEVIRDAESEGRQLARTLDAISQISGLGVAYAMARLAKFSDGGLLPVAGLPSAEVRRCMEIAYKAAEALRTCGELRKMAEDDGSPEAARTTPVPRLVEPAAPRPAA